jgi:DNA polymerase-3 subunit gamma/tau
MDCIEEMASEVTDYAEALADIVSELQRIAVHQVVPESASADGEDIAARKALAEKLSAEDVQLYYQMGIMSGRDLALAPDPRSGFEMAMLRMLAFRPATGGAAAVTPARAAPGTPQKNPSQASESVSPPAAVPVPARRTAHAPAAQNKTADAERTPAPTQTPAGFESAPAKDEPRTIKAEEWAADIEAMGLVGLTRELACNCLVVACDEHGIKMRLDPGHEQLTAPRVKEKLEHALERYCGRSLRVDIEIVVPGGETPALAKQREIELRQQAAVEAIEGDSGVQAICDTFGAVVDGERVRPVD